MKIRSVLVLSILAALATFNSLDNRQKALQWYNEKPLTRRPSFDILSTHRPDSPWGYRR